MVDSTGLQDMKMSTCCPSSSVHCVNAEDLMEQAQSLETSFSEIEASKVSAICRTVSVRGD